MAKIGQFRRKVWRDHGSVDMGRCSRQKSEVSRGQAEEQIITLDESSWLTLHQVFDEGAALRWMMDLIGEVEVEERSIRLFGKSVLQPRLIGWGGDVPYTYSRQTLPPRAMGKTLKKLMDLTCAITQHDFNHALVNLYRSGNDSMGMHSDDEAELGGCPKVASWSMGAPRRLVFAQKKGKKRHQLILPSGSLLVMEGATQLHFRHGLPKDKSESPRLNVTFRSVVNWEGES